PSAAELVPALIAVALGNGAYTRPYCAVITRTVRPRRHAKGLGDTRMSTAFCCKWWLGASEWSCDCCGFRVPVRGRSAALAGPRQAAVRRYQGEAGAQDLRPVGRAPAGARGRPVRAATRRWR